MILGFHNMVDAVGRYAAEHLTAEKAWWLLAMNGLLFIPLIFAMFFYPALILVGVGVALFFVVAFVALARVVHAHRQRTEQR